MATLTPIARLETQWPFTALPIEAATYDGIVRHMREAGFDDGNAIRVWRNAFGEKGRMVVTDGHTRLRAARELGLAEVPIIGRHYATVDDALADTIQQQSLRRNLSGDALVAYVLEVIPVLDDTSHAGAGSRNDLHGRSATQLAQMLNVGKATIDRARRVLACGDPVLLARVKAGEIGLQKAAALARQIEAVGGILVDGTEPEAEPVMPEPPERPAKPEPPPGSHLHTAVLALYREHGGYWPSVARDLELELDWVRQQQEVEQQ